jgi:hypothetical protein
MTRTFAPSSAANASHGVGEQDRRLVVDVVVHVGAVQGEDGDGVLPLDQQLRHAVPSSLK